MSVEILMVSSIVFGFNLSLQISDVKPSKHSSVSQDSLNEVMVLVKEDALKHSLEALMKVLQMEKNILKVFLSFLRQKMGRIPARAKKDSFNPSCSQFITDHLN